MKLNILLKLIAFENLQFAYFVYALLFSANKIFQKQTIFVFTVSWSHDQLLQKAYW